MTADYFTKPLQGALFKKFRDQIMNLNPMTTGSQDCRSVLRKPNMQDCLDLQHADDIHGTDKGWTMDHGPHERKKEIESCSPF